VTYPLSIVAMAFVGAACVTIPCRGATAEPHWLSLDPSDAVVLAEVAAASDALAPEAALANAQLPPLQLPPMKVQASSTAELKEEQPVGSYGQPGWTTSRRFPNVRIYVIPEHAVETEVWVVPQWNKDRTFQMRTLFELEYGFARHWQFDLYLRFDKFPGESQQHIGGQFEVRYALADWGKIFGNPTVYLEYAPLEDEPSTLEGKLLFGDQLMPRLHWGLNLSIEQQLSDQCETEYQFDFGLSYTVIDQFFSIGPEIRGDYVNNNESRSDFEKDVRLGPSMQIRPTPKWFINIAPLFGITHNAGRVQLWFNMGYEF
jgi:hypothetical protein